MQSNNHFNRVETQSDFNHAMTVQGAIQKSVILTVIAAVVGVSLFLYSFMTLNISITYSAAMVERSVDLFWHSMATTFKPNTAPHIWPFLMRCLKGHF